MHARFTRALGAAVAAGVLITLGLAGAGCGSSTPGAPPPSPRGHTR